MIYYTQSLVKSPERSTNERQSPQRSKLAAWVASPGRLWGNPKALRVRQSPTEGDPPAALVSPDPSVGKPSPKLPQRGEPDARYLCRETLIKYWLRKAQLLAGLAPSGFTSRLRRETRSEVATTRGTRARHFSLLRWIHRKALPPNDQ
ncbi:hypothetical protein [Brasilonema sennae]|uniref:hypothetical protein n=1 Tax=Brasilonema sennae TaxID=1397703 RepID=UPI00155B3399|nr:hypothetical protein [Brasilonema sennae]